MGVLFMVSVCSYDSKKESSIEILKASAHFIGYCDDNFDDLPEHFQEEFKKMEKIVMEDHGDL